MFFENKKLGEVCDVISGQSPESKYYNENGEGLPFFQGKTEFTNKYIGNPRTWTKYTTKESIKNDILMSVRAPVGPVNINGFDKICIGRGLCAIRPSNKVELDYLFNFLLSIQEQLTGNRGSVFASINRSQIENIEIPLPPLETQKAIVAKLDQIFAELDQTKSEIQKNLNNTDELWKSALNQAFQGDWKIKKLGEVCDVIAGQSPESDFYNEKGEGLPFFQGKTEFTEKYLGEPKKWTTKTTKESLKNDILMSVRAPVGPVNINTFEKICIGRGLCAIRPGNNVKLDYVFNYLLSIQDKISGNRGSVFDSINRNQIESIEIPVPPLSEQEKIVEHLDQVSKEVKALKSQYQSQLDNLEELKKSVLDKAFRGELGE